MSSEDRMMDQTAVLEHGSEGGKRTQLTHWDVKPSLPILLIQPRQDVSKGLQVRGSGTGLTSRQPQVDPIQEQVQIAKRDRRVQRAQELQIKAGSAAEPIFHLHLQEPILTVMIQPQRLVNKVHMTKLDMLTQRTDRPEPLLAVPLREQPRLNGDWAGKPTFGHPQTFSRLPFAMLFSRTLSEWGMM